MHTTIIRGGRLLDAARHAAEPADLLIEGDTVREIGPPGMAAPADAAAVDAAGRLLMPGLVNAHTHGHNNLAKSLGDRWTLELLLNAAPWLTGGRTLEDKYLSTLIGAVEMVRKGCTAAYDLNFELPAPTTEGLEAIGRAYADAGMRAVVAPMMADRTFHRAIPGLLDALPADLRREAEAISLEPFETSLAAWERARAAWPFDEDRVRLALAPTIPHHCSEAFLRAARRLAAEHEAGFHTHLAESKVQALAGMRLYGRTQTAWLDSLGVLGPRFTAAHAVWLDRDDMRRLGDAGASVAHNPGSNARLGNGLAAARALLDAGVRVGIGTDACTCSDNLNMFEAMRIASMVSRVQEHDYERWLATGEVLDMATRGSAGVLGFGDRIGALEPGRKADVVFLDLGHVNYVPLNDPVNQIVHGEDGTGVESVMIGGRMVLEGRRMVTVDEAKLARDAAAAAERLAAVTADTRAMMERLEAAVGRYAVAWSREDYHIERHARCTI